jgi:hypothetical protein
LTWELAASAVVACIIAAGEVTARIIYFSSRKKASEIPVLTLLPRVPGMSLFRK